MSVNLNVSECECKWGSVRMCVLYMSALSVCTVCAVCLRVDVCKCECKNANVCSRIFFGLPALK